MMSSLEPNLEYEPLDRLLSAVLKSPVSLKKIAERVVEVMNLVVPKTETEQQQQERFGELIGCSQSQVSRYARGERYGKNPDIFIKIAELDPQQRGLYWLLTGQTEQERDAALTHFVGIESGSEPFIVADEALRELTVAGQETASILEELADVHQKAVAHAQRLRSLLHKLTQALPPEKDAESVSLMG